MPKFRLLLAVLLAGLAFVASACGDDNDQEPASDPPVASTPQEDGAATETSPVEEEAETGGASADAEISKDLDTEPKIAKPSGDPPAELQTEDVVKGKGKTAKEGDNVCYGEPVRHDDRTVIPVTRVRATAGWGHGTGTKGAKGERETGEGGGGGGHVDAIPAGFIEIGPTGSAFHEIRDPERTGRLLKAGAAAATTLLAGVAGVRTLRGGVAGGRRVKGLLNR